MNNRVYNFGAGPAMLPESILIEARDELLNWQNLGISILEVGHRTPEFTALLQRAEHSLRELLHIPDCYHVLFLGGAARTQFAMIPLNFLNAKDQGGYLVSGLWSDMALQEARHLKQAYCVSGTEGGPHLDIPESKNFIIKDNLAYLYYAPNETVNGIRFPYVPKISGIPLIADMTSCLLSEPIDVSSYDLIFSGAQKNIANAGLTVVIIKNSLLEKQSETPVPLMLDYQVHAKHQSLYATPPVFNCYLADKMFGWIKDQGGVEVLFEKNCKKAAKLYQYLDGDDFYSTPVDPQARSIINVCFSPRKPGLEQAFVEQAKQRGLYALKGHSKIGGLRASLYNAMPIEGVDALIEFMKHFAREHQ